MKNNIRYSLFFALTTIASINIGASEEQTQNKYVSPFRWPATQVMLKILAGDWDNSENPHIDPRVSAIPPKKAEITSCIYRKINNRRKSYDSNQKSWLEHTDPSDLLSNDAYIKSAYEKFATDVAQKEAPVIAITARLEQMLSDVDKHTLSKKNYPVHTRLSLLENLKTDCLPCAISDEFGFYDYTLEKLDAYGIYDKECPYTKNIRPFAKTKRSTNQQ